MALGIDPNRSSLRTSATPDQEPIARSATQPDQPLVEPHPELRASELPKGRTEGLSPGLLTGLHQRAVSAVMLGALGAVLGLGTGISVAHAEEPTTAPPATAAVEPPAKAATDTVRAPARLELDNPLTHTSTNAALYSFVPRAAGTALDALHQKYPEIDRHFAARFLEWSAVVGAEVPWMVLSHEGGHYRVADQNGWKPRIEMTGWMSGMTYYEGAPPLPLGDRREIAASAAGVNQVKLDAGLMYEDWARNGHASYAEAMAFLLAETNTSLYSARSALRDANNIPGSDDMAAYVRGINARGQKLTIGHLVAMSALTDLLSAPNWAALIGQFRYLANGDRQIEMPTFKLGNVEATFPNFHTLLTSDGPVIGGRLLVSPKAKMPVELSVDVRVDGSAAAVGAKLFDLPLAKDLSLNPFLRVSADKTGGAGARVGSELNWRPAKNLVVTGTAAFSAQDLLREVEGQKEGLELRINLGFGF